MTAPAANEHVEHARGALTLRQRAEEAGKARIALDAADARRADAERIAKAETELRSLLAKHFAVEPEYFIVAEGEQLEAHVDGLAFILAHEPYEDWDGLCVVVGCKKGCGKPLWKRVDTEFSQYEPLERLYAAIDSEHAHDWDCLKATVAPPSHHVELSPLERRLGELFREIIRDELDQRGVTAI